MNEEQLFSKLCQIIDRLLGPGGCPWDQKQTLESLRHSVLEETCELIDSIEDKNTQGMTEELGDLMLNVVFLAKVAAKEGHFTLKEALDSVNTKLIFRHPHVFGEGKKIDTVEQLVDQWEELKKREKGSQSPKSAMDNIPKSLPSLARAQKMLKKMERVHYEVPTSAPANPHASEEAFGQWLFEAIHKANEQGIDAELALRRACALQESTFRSWESTSG